MPMNAGVAGDLRWWVLLESGKGQHTSENQRVIAKCSSETIARMIAALHEFGAYQRCEVINRDVFAQAAAKEAERVASDIAS